MEFIKILDAQFAEYLHRHGFEYCTEHTNLGTIFAFRKTPELVLVLSGEYASSRTISEGVLRL